MNASDSLPNQLTMTFGLKHMLYLKHVNAKIEEKQKLAQPPQSSRAYLTYLLRYYLPTTPKNSAKVAKILLICSILVDGDWDWMFPYPPRVLEKQSLGVDDGRR